MATQLQRGHEESVLCCATTSEGKVISGGENGEICLWAVNGQSFIKTTLESGEDLTSVCCARTQNHVVYVSGGQELFEFDLRQFDKPTYQYKCNKEEINHIAINEKDDFLASCDDSGQIKIIQLREKRVFKTLRKHSNICASVSFRTRRPWDLFSGGYDKQLIQWDFSRGRSVCIINMDEIGTMSDTEFIVNPPFIHSLSTSYSGKYLACGIENAQVQVFNASKRTPEFLATLSGHTQGVSQVHFAAFEDSESILVSGGNDGQIIIWNIEHLHASPVNGHTSASSDVATAAPSAPKVHINHGEKVNWISTGRTANRKFLVVADNSNALTVYPFLDI